MRIRIPGPVDRALEVACRCRLASVAIVAAGATAAYLLRHSVRDAVAAILLTACYLVTAVMVVQVRRERERRRDLEADLFTAHTRIKELQTGDPTAPTAQFRSIGDTGELT